MTVPFGGAETPFQQSSVLLSARSVYYSFGFAGDVDRAVVVLML